MQVQWTNDYKDSRDSGAARLSGPWFNRKFGALSFEARRDESKGVGRQRQWAPSPQAWRVLWTPQLGLGQTPLLGVFMFFEHNCKASVMSDAVWRAMLGDLRSLVSQFTELPERPVSMPQFKGHHHVWHQRHYCWRRSRLLQTEICSAASASSLQCSNNNNNGTQSVHQQQAMNSRGLQFEVAYWPALAVGGTVQLAATHARMNRLWTCSLQLDRPTHPSPAETSSFTVSQSQCPFSYTASLGICPTTFINSRQQSFSVHCLLSSNRPLPPSFRCPLIPLVSTSCSADFHLQEKCLLMPKYVCFCVAIEQRQAMTHTLRLKLGYCLN